MLLVYNSYMDTKKKILNSIIKIFWIFVLGSIFGFVLETVYTLVFKGTLSIRQGLIYGPFIQIYGIAAVAYCILISKIKDPKEAFFSGMIMGGVLEYVCSFLQEIFFGTISWDYSGIFLNLNGRICLLYCIYWGIIAVVFLKVVYPIIERLTPLIEKKGVRIITIFAVIFMVFDITISCMAGSRQLERRENIPANSPIDEFLDKNYPDEYLDKIYNNRKDV